MVARVVIGAGFGDEGKGATVDRLSRPDTVVVRFNGGAQAGHTVVAPDGRAHVFHHVGSGSFRGAATFLSRHMVASPMHLLPELAELRGLGVRPRVMADARALLTTPYDMLLNQAAERARAERRHGSCGYGVGETIERAGHGLGTTLADLRDPAGLRRRLRAIRADWVPARGAALGLHRLSAEAAHDVARLVGGDDLAEAFLAAAAAFREAVEIVDGPAALSGADLVFEGAQGLALDQDRGAFPHVTRSHTGLCNALAVAGELGVRRLAVTYVTRCYTTRHGAGPLPGERPAAPVERFRDTTNQPNPWQGSLRFAVLDADALAARIHADLADAEGSGIAIAPALAVTCLDQAGAGVVLRWNGRERKVPTGELTQLLLDRLGFDEGTAATGPGRFDARRVRVWAKAGAGLRASSGPAACRPPSGPSPTRRPRPFPASSCGRPAR